MPKLRKLFVIVVGVGGSGKGHFIENELSDTLDKFYPGNNYSVNKFEGIIDERIESSSKYIRSSRLIGDDFDDILGTNYSYEETDMIVDCIRNSSNNKIHSQNHFSKIIKISKKFIELSNLLTANYFDFRNNYSHICNFDIEIFDNVKANKNIVFETTGTSRINWLGRDEKVARMLSTYDIVLVQIKMDIHNIIKNNIRRVVRKYQEGDAIRLLPLDKKKDNYIEKQHNLFSERMSKMYYKCEKTQKWYNDEGELDNLFIDNVIIYDNDPRKWNFPLDEIVIAKQCKY